MNSLKKGEGVPLLNFVGGPGVPLINFEGGPGASLLNFKEGSRSKTPGILGAGVLVPLLHHANLSLVLLIKVLLIIECKIRHKNIATRLSHFYNVI